MTPGEKGLFEDGEDPADFQPPEDAGGELDLQDHPVTLEEKVEALGRQIVREEAAGSDDDRALFFQRLHAAQERAKPIQATRTPEYGQWKYASEGDIVDALKAILLDEGLVLTASNPALEETPTETKKGDPQWRTRVRLEFQLTDKDTGYTERFPYHGVAELTGDKGPRHAVSAATKPFLLGLLFTYTTDEAPPPESRQSGRPTGRRRSSGGDSPRNQKATEAKRLSDVKAAFRDRFGALEPWQRLAIARAHPEVPDDRAEWDAGAYETVVRMVRGRSPVSVATAAVKTLKEDEPLQEETEEKARALAEEIDTFSARATLEAAIESGWEVAVAYFLENPPTNEEKES